MKRCPKCMREYDDTSLFCKIDGEDLVRAIAIAPRSTAETHEPDEPIAPDELPDITVMHYGGDFNDDPTGTATLEAGDATRNAPTATRASGTAPSTAALGSQDIEDPFQGELLEGRYRILERLSVGGMGMVYRAVDTNLNDLEVAIKFIRPEIAKRSRFRQIFQDAELLLAKIQHSNVVRVYNFDETSDGYLYLVMDFVPGQSLRHYIYRRREEGASAGRRRQIRADTELLRQIASGLQAMHHAGIVHRDLKPDNILLQPQPGGGFTPRIIDFGIATQIDPQSGQTPLDDASRIMSTNYAPPEQILHEPMDFRSDVFSFGLIAYELLARQNPLKIRTSDRSRTRRTPRSTTAKARASNGGTGTGSGSAAASRGSTASSPSVDANMLDNLERIDRIPPLRRLAPVVPRNLERIVLRCLEYDPGQRYENASVVQRELDRFLAQRRRIHALLSIAAVLLLLAGGALGIALSSRQKLLRTALDPTTTGTLDIRAGDVGILHVGPEVPQDLRLSLSPNDAIEGGEIFVERDGERWEGELRLRDLEARLPRRLLAELPDGEYTVYLRLEGSGRRPFTTSPRSLRLHKDSRPPTFTTGVEGLRTDVPHRWLTSSSGVPTLFVGSPRFQIQGEVEDANLKRLSLWDPSRNESIAVGSFTSDREDRLLFSLPVEDAANGNLELVAEDWAGNVTRLPIAIAVRTGRLPLELRLTGEGLPAEGLPLDRLEALGMIPVRGDYLTVTGDPAASEGIPLAEITATLAGSTFQANERDLEASPGAVRRRRLLRIPLEEVPMLESALLEIRARDALGREASAQLSVRPEIGPTLTLAGQDLHDEGPTVVARITGLDERLTLRAEGVLLRRDQVECRISIRSDGASRAITSYQTQIDETTALIEFSPGVLLPGTHQLQVTLNDELQQSVVLLGGRPVFLVVDPDPPEVSLGPAYSRAPEELVRTWQSRRETLADLRRELWILNATALEQEHTTLGITMSDVDLLRGWVVDVDRGRSHEFKNQRNEKGRLLLESPVSLFRQEDDASAVKFLDPDWIFEELRKERRETRLDIALEDGTGKRTTRHLLILVDKRAPRIEIASPTVQAPDEESAEWIVTDSRYQVAENAPLRLTFRLRDGETGLKSIRFNAGSPRPVEGAQYVFEEPVADTHLVAEVSDWAGNRSRLKLRVPRPPSQTLPWRLPASGEVVTFRLVRRGPFTMGNGQRLAESGQATLVNPFEAVGSETIPSRPEKEVVLENDLYLSENEITNGQYRAFVLAKGYENNEYWDLRWTVETADGPQTVDAATWITSSDFLTDIDLPKPGTVWLDPENRHHMFRAADGRPGPRAWRGDRWPEGESADHPVTGVSFLEAMAFSRWLGSLYQVADHMRLPNEREWEGAARRNPDGDPRRYVWGEQWTQERCHFSRPRKTLVTDYANEGGDVSATGLFNLAGNVSEWVIPYPAHYAPTERKAWFRGVYRGGSFDDLASSEASEVVQVYFTTFVHREADIRDRARTRGFRCLIPESQLPRELRN